MPPTNTNNNNRIQESVSAIIERHLVSVGITLLLGAVVWAGNSLTKNIETTARTDERLSNIELDIKDLKTDIASRMRDQYTTADAARHAVECAARVGRLEKRQDKIELRVDLIEKAQIKNGLI